MSDTDYKQLWRREKDNNVKLSNMVFQMQEHIKVQADVIRRIRDGELKPDEIAGTGIPQKDEKIEEIINQAKGKITPETV